VYSSSINLAFTAMGNSHASGMWVSYGGEIQLLSTQVNFAIKFATKFLCVKTSSGKVVATWIAVDVHIGLIFALKVNHPIRKSPILTDFAQ